MEPAATGSDGGTADEDAGGDDPRNGWGSDVPHGVLVACLRWLAPMDIQYASMVRTCG